MKTLVIVSHPYPERSKATKALEEIAATVPGVTVRNLETLYGNNINGFDLAAEQKAQEEADRVVYLFPIHWFNLTPMLKAYLNEVWAYGWAFGPEAAALKGKEMQVVTTAGASEFTYSADGLIKSSMEDVLTPMKASAYYVGMKYNQPLAFHNAIGASDEAIAEYQKAFVTLLNLPLATA
ncbi:MAG: flavodoxin family protein [Gammaproteobacteria bacterium]|nr:flavodoxin family protein [Gammaproteobacteria bacterium]